MKQVQKVVIDGEQLRNNVEAAAGSDTVIETTSPCSSCEQSLHASPVVQPSNLELSSDRVKELTNQIDQCREAQFKSNFHQATYGWRLMLEDTTADVDSSSTVANDASKRSIANSEVIADDSSNSGNDYIYDFDLFFESYFVADDDKEKPAFDAVTTSEMNTDLTTLASSFGWFDEELMQILLSESEALKFC